MNFEFKLSIIFLMLLFVTSTHAQSIILSTSDSDPFAGSSVTIESNEIGLIFSLYVWADPLDDQRIVGMGMDILSDNVATLEATQHEIFDPELASGVLTRWDGFTAGMLGDLVTDSNAVAVTQRGIADDNTALGDVSVNGHFLHSRVDFIGTGFGTSDITLAANSSGFADLDGIVDPSLGSGFVTVVPEPGGLLGLAVVSVICLARTRRRKS